MAAALLFRQKNGIFRHISSLFFLSLLFSGALSLSEAEALLKFKKSIEDPLGALSSWAPNSSDPCSRNGTWVGVVCYSGIVSGIRLGNLSLAGEIDVSALAGLHGLRSVSLVRNLLSGPMPAFDKLGALKSLYLSRNQFTGEIRTAFFSNMNSLKKVWLDGNEFSGEIPTSLGSLNHLLELHLEGNQFSGTIPTMNQTGLKSFNVSENLLQGQVPANLAKFGMGAFAGNVKLCGGPLDEVCAEMESEAAESSDLGHQRTMMVVVGLALLIVMVGVIALRRVSKGQPGHIPRGMESLGGKERKAEPRAAAPPGGGASLVFVNGEKEAFRMTDLMKAAAEILGTGSFGSSYKAVMGTGKVVVVKRLREMEGAGQDGFEAEMRRLGRLRHRNIMAPLAYHYRMEEKLLVYDYVGNGSLLYILHGDRGPGKASLDWPTRLKIIRGIARGMSYLHRELISSDVPHGHLKSSNILIDSEAEPLLTDFGFAPLADPNLAVQALAAYRSPEFIELRQVSPKSDIWAFGIVILEVLTGKFPSQYLNSGKGGTDLPWWVSSAVSENKAMEVIDPDILSSSSRGSSREMVRVLHIGLACTEPNPEDRPDMWEVERRIEEIREDGESSGSGHSRRQISARRNHNEWRQQENAGFGIS
ncbi:pollen receptor-like kinase 3 [Amborella trichopoda]|uniref:Protein kinase domain-containing protein n=1 Tax=Amborella trichopoda TaxID=13333 RepID=W1PMV2_AMBTC|nr:pollen receptor-like kinase 3 [Amborella trichopoda]ERN11347.1 hypothetical protein AMTR_s00024p00252010 [Amborella trichopoda]|eukprot:XP_006849766.1 pollen receptor-like kinase 3 [Amborella trichopoda]